MASPILKYLLPEEYLEQERVAESKHEYFKSEFVAMARAPLAYKMF